MYSYAIKAHNPYKIEASLHFVVLGMHVQIIIQAIHLVLTQILSRTESSKLFSKSI